MKTNKLFSKKGHTPPFQRYVMGLLLFCTFVFYGNNAVSQTVLINPAQEGGFELGATFPANGWTLINDATNTWNIGNVPAWQTGTNCAYVSNNGGAAWDYTKTLNQRSFFYRDIAFPAGETNIILSFDWRAYGESNWDNLSIYVTDVAVTPSNVGPVSSATTVTGWAGYTDGTTGYYLTKVSGSSVPTTTTSASYTFTVPQATFAAGSTKRLIFVWKNDSGSGTTPPASVDNISLVSSCSPVVAIAGSGATASSFNANWNTLTGATGYNVQYRANGSLTWIDASGNPYAATTASISGLTDNSAYEYRVAAVGPVCNAYSNVISITTACNAFTVPYNEGFEAGYTHNTPVAGCISQSSITGTGVWTANNTLTTNNRTPNTGAWNAFLGWSNEDWLFFPIQLTAGTSYRLKFYARQDGPTATNSNVLASYGDANNAAAMTNSIVASTGIINGDYQMFVGDFTPTSTGVFYVGIKGFMNGTPNNISIDDISLSLTPTCFEPVAITVSAITENTAAISWTAPSIIPGVGYEYEVRSSGLAGSGLTGLVATGTTLAGVLTDNIAGLMQNSVYKVYVRSLCDATDMSAWSNGVSFTTACGTVNVPYLQDFETVTIPALPNCTSVENAGTGNLWKTFSGTSNGFTGKFLRYTYSGASAANTWFYSPGINLNAGTSYRISYDYGAAGYDENLKVAYGTSATSIDMTNLLKDHVGFDNTFSTTSVVDFIPTTSGVYYFGFNAYSTANQFYLHVDNISIVLTPPCSTPLTLSATPSSLTSGSLIWSQSSSFPSDGYEYEVRESGAAGSGATGLIETNTTLAGDTTATITGLTANTTYTAYVRANCGLGVYSDWTNASTFTTSYCTPTPEDVDDLGITNVSVGMIDNTTGAETGNYFDYSAMSTDMELGSSQTVAITFETGYVYNTKVWIDFNDDLDFDDANEEVYSGASTSANPTTLMATFDIPVGVNLGSHRMRIGGVYGEAATPCYPGGFFTYGSFEDYTVNIICPTTIPAATAIGADACTGSSAQLVATGITDAVLTWYDAATAGNILAVNDTLNTAPVTSTTSFWVEQTYAACPLVSSDRTEVSVTTFDVIVDLDVTDISCNGLTDGSVSVGTITCGTAPFMYSINGMPYGAAPSDLTAGTYSVRVRDANMNESNFMSVTIVEPTYITPAPTTTNGSVCVDATSGAIVTAESASITVVGTPVVLSFDLSAQPTEVNSAPGSVISSVTMPALPSGAVVTSVTLNMNNITSGVGSWDSEVRLGVQGSIANSALKGTGTLNSASTFNYTRDLPVSSVDVAGGLVELLYWNSSNDVDPGDDATFPLGNGVATITIEYTIPDPATVYTWWTAPTGGTQVGTGASLETIGTSVVASPAVAGTYMLYAQTESGACVSPMRTVATVQVNAPTSSTVTRVACASPYTFNGQDFTTAGTYTVTIPNSAGCDSVITLNLTFGTPSASTVTRFSCVNPFVFNGQSFTTAGTYTVVIPNISGCDSTITLDLTFGTPTTHTITTVSCASPYTLNGTDYTTAGTFTQLLVNAAGCDSTITLNLTFGTPSDSTVTAHTCASPFTFNGQDYTTAGTYTVVIPNASGCDSTITLNLTFGTPNTSTLTEEACGFYVYNGMTYTQSGTYTHVFTNASGCDSTVTLNLTINTVSTPVATVDGITLTASGATGSFVWINCANDESVGNGSTFTATENGSYSVIVTTSAGCTAVSECVIVNQVGIDKNEMLSGIAIYPNPTTSNVTISMADDKLVNAKLYDAQGKLINTIKNVKNGTVISLDTLENGVYMIHVSNETGNQVFRIVKQ